jgi:hypothetical protein
MIHRSLFTLVLILGVWSGAGWLIANQLRAEPVQMREPVIRHLVDWVESEAADTGFLGWIRDRVKEITGLVVRITSPDVRPESRRLWVIPASGGEPQRLAQDTGARNPRWGKRGFIAFEQEADTNGDGSIDALDHTLIRVVRADGGESVKVGQGSAPVWSPDGLHLAFIREDTIWVHRLGGEAVPLTQAVLSGTLIGTDRLTSALVTSFWAIPVRGGAPRQLPPDLGNRYVWLGAVSPSGKRLVFHNAMRSDIYIRWLQNAGREINLTNDPYTDMDPAWSPDERFVVFVSDR